MKRYVSYVMIVFSHMTIYDLPENLIKSDIPFIIVTQTLSWIETDLNEMADYIFVLREDYRDNRKSLWLDL